MSITLIIIIMTCIISWQGFNGQNEKLLFYPYAMKRNGQWYRFLSHGFVHGSFGHLAINMFVLYMFGEQVEYVFEEAFGLLPGKIMYIAMYILGILVSSIYSYFKHSDNPAYRAVGASGAVSAITFAFIVFAPWEWLLLFFVIPIPAVVFGVLYLIYSQYMERQGTDNIGHDAHFWGAVWGLVFTLVSLVLLRPVLLDIIWRTLLAGPSMPTFFQ